MLRNAVDLKIQTIEFPSIATARWTYSMLSQGVPQQLSHKRANIDVCKQGVQTDISALLRK